MSYYKKQLELVDTTSEFAPTVKIISGEGSGATKWMNVNKESAEALVEWLTKNFIGEPEVKLLSEDKKNCFVIPESNKTKLIVSGILKFNGTDWVYPSEDWEKVSEAIKNLK